MPGRMHFLPALAIALLSFATNALAEDTRTAAKILQGYRSALGQPERIRTLAAKSTFFSGRERMSGVHTYWGKNGAWKRVFRRTPQGKRVDSFSRHGAFLFAGRARARYQPGARTSRAWYYAMDALAHPFALDAYARDEKAQAGLTVGQAQGYDVLATVADTHGVRTLYFVERETGHLGQVRFESEQGKPFATLQYGEYELVDGVRLPRLIVVELRLETEDEAKRTWKQQRYSFKERVNEWTVNPETLPDLAPPHPPAMLPAGYRRSVHSTVAEPHDLTVADLDRDGKSDIAVAGLGGVAIHFGGALDQPLHVALGSGSHRGCRVTDFDLDGVPDLIVMSWTDPSDSYFAISFPKDRAPRVRRIYAAPHFGHALIVDDFDRDGLPDLAASGYASRDVSWKFGNGSGGFRVVGTTWMLKKGGKNPQRAFGLASGDLNNDGIREIAVAEPGRPRVVIFRGEPNLSFQPRLALDDKNAGLVRPVDVCFADLDNDGRDDLLIAQEHPLKDLEGDIGVMINKGDGFRVGGFLAAGERTMSVRAADLDGDGNQDVIAPSFMTDQLALLSGKGDGTFAPALFAGVARGPVRAEIGDIDRDGRPDVVVACRIDGSLTILHNTGGTPRSPAPKPATQVVEAFRPGTAKLTGLSEEYEFAGEWRLPSGVLGPSGLAFLHHDGATTGLVLVSDRSNVLYRATLDHVRDRLMVAPPIPLQNAPRRHLDLEGIAFDRASGTLFLGCESDNSVWRTTLFGDFLGRAKTGIPVADNDGIEGLAVRRKRDGTPLLYVFKERLATSGIQPPVFVYDMKEAPFTLTQRGKMLRLPSPLVDQTGATIVDQRLFAVSRFARSIVEIEFEGDGFGKKFKAAGYSAATQKLLGYPGLPAFGMVEAIARSANGDLYLVADNNRTVIGREGANRGTEGRLIRFRCLTPRKVALQVDRVKVRIIFIPVAGADGPQLTKRTSEQSRAIADSCRKEAAAGADFDALRRRFHDPRGRLPAVATVVRAPLQKKLGELDERAVPVALFRLIFSLATGETEVCEYDPKQSPWGYYVVQRIE
ncbi:MAG: FG-GAP-like repeat-containing protein [Planctomycetota bacterium]